MISWSTDLGQIWLQSVGLVVWRAILSLIAVRYSFLVWTQLYNVCLEGYYIGAYGMCAVVSCLWEYIIDPPTNSDLSSSSIVRFVSVSRLNDPASQLTQNQISTQISASSIVLAAIGTRFEEA